jgi:hypothetical protein
MAQNEHASCGEAAPVAFLHERAMDNLSFIRDAMARSAPLTAVSGWGTVVMGCAALVGACVGSLRRTEDWWIGAWLAVAFAGCLSGFAGMVLKSRRQRTPLFSAVGRNFALSLFPPIFAGVVLTEVLYERELDALMPGVWLMMYGVGVVTGGAFSIKVLPLTGFCFIFLGVYAFYPPVPIFDPVIGTLTCADLILAAGFGLFHIVSGLYIAWRHDG